MFDSIPIGVQSDSNPICDGHLSLIYELGHMAAQIFTTGTGRKSEWNLIGTLLETASKFTTGQLAAVVNLRPRPAGRSYIYERLAGPAYRFTTGDGWPVVYFRLASFPHSANLPRTQI